MTSLQILLPGDTLPVASSSISKLGPGTLQTSARFSSTASSSSSTNQLLIATKAGQFGSDKTGKRIYVEGRGKRYVPASQESVIGTVIARHGEGYRVDIGSAHHASLDALAFEGATKRNKPNLKVGSLVYARISLANRDMEPELECFDATTRKSDGFGELKEGMTVTCSLQMSRRLLVPSYPLLRSLSSRVAFECAIGTNAQVWIKAGSIKGAIAVGRAIQEVDSGRLDVESVAQWVDTLESLQNE